MRETVAGVFVLGYHLAALVRGEAGGHDPLHRVERVCRREGHSSSTFPMSRRSIDLYIVIVRQEWGALSLREQGKSVGKKNGCFCYVTYMNVDGG